MVAVRDRPDLTPEEYLDWEPRQEMRYEYLNGTVVAMTGGSIAHSAIAVNAIALLRPHVRGSGCRVLGSDAKVGLLDRSAFFYPDVLVTCDDRDRAADKAVFYPKLLVEVLSPATEAYDRGGKFARYRQIESLQEYVLIGSECVLVEVFRLNDRRKWELSAYGEGDAVKLESVGFECAIAALYEDVSLAEG